MWPGRSNICRRRLRNSGRNSPAQGRRWLDNVGLFAALRWHVQSACNGAGLVANIRVPEQERRFLPNIPIALFRIVQEALAVIVARKPVATAEFSATVDQSWLTFEIRSEAAAAPDDGASMDVNHLAAVEQRIQALGGEFTSAATPAGGTSITARFPTPAIIVQV